MLGRALASWRRRGVELSRIDQTAQWILAGQEELREEVSALRHTPPEETAAPAGPVMYESPGHFYSPVPDTAELARDDVAARVWPPVPREQVGVDWRDAEQLRVLEELARQPVLEFPAEAEDPTTYRVPNGAFDFADGWFLQGMLRMLKPRRVIEVGCGHSSLLTARVNRECFDGEMEFVCIEPYPPPFLQGGVEGISRLEVSKVEDVDPSTFASLQSGDVLFIDTSHTVKTGNDVVWLFQEVVPRVAPGVVIHIHDMFFPWDYPREWIVDEGRGWNEQYLVQAFLSYNEAFEVMLGAHWLFHHHREALARVRPELGEAGGGSLWIRRAR